MNGSQKSSEVFRGATALNEWLSAEILRVAATNSSEVVDDVASNWYTQRKTPRIYETAEKALVTTG